MKKLLLGIIILASMGQFASAMTYVCPSIDDIRGHTLLPQQWHLLNGNSDDEIKRDVDPASYDYFMQHVTHFSGASWYEDIPFNAQCYYDGPGIPGEFTLALSQDIHTTAPTPNAHWIQGYGRIDCDGTLEQCAFIEVTVHQNSG